LSVERIDGAADFWRHLCGTLQRAAATGQFPRPDGLPDRRYLTRLTHAFLELPRPLAPVIDESDHLGCRGGSNKTWTSGSSMAKETSTDRHVPGRPADTGSPVAAAR